MFGFKKKKSQEQPESVDAILGSIKDIIDNKEGSKAKEDEVFDLTTVYQDNKKQDLIKNLNEKNITEQQTPKVAVEKSTIVETKIMQEMQNIPSLKKSVLDEIDDILDINAKKELSEAISVKPKEEIKTHPQEQTKEKLEEKIEVKPQEIITENIQESEKKAPLVNNEDAKLWETESLKEENTKKIDEVPKENYNEPLKAKQQKAPESSNNIIDEKSSFSEVQFEEIKSHNIEEKSHKNHIDIPELSKVEQQKAKQEYSTIIDEKPKENTQVSKQEEPGIALDNENKLDDSFKMILKEGAAKEIENEIRENIRLNQEKELESIQNEQIQTSIQSSPLSSPISSPFQAIEKLNSHIEAIKEEKRKGSQTIEDLVKESIKPLITKWLDENLARIVEVAVEKEIKKLIDERK